MYGTVFYSGLFVFITSALGLIIPSTMAVKFLLPGGITALVCLGIGGVLMHSAIFAYFQQGRFKYVFRLLGCVLPLVAVAGLFSPTYLGLLQNYVSTADLITVLLSGIACLLASLEYPEYKSEDSIEQIFAAYRRYRKYMLARRPPLKNATVPKVWAHDHRQTAKSAQPQSADVATRGGRHQPPRRR